MSHSSSSEPTSTPPSHHDGAYAAWGCLLGALLGAALGAWLRHWWQGALAVGAVGWIAGALIDRARR